MGCGGFFSFVSRIGGGLSITECWMLMLVLE